MDLGRADFGLLRTLVERVPWETVLKGKGLQEGWAFFKKEAAEGAGAGRPHVPCDEPAGKTTGLAEQGALAGTRGGKRRV